MIDYTEVVYAPVDSLKSLTPHYRLMDLILSIIPFAGSALMTYYACENYRYVNVCLPGVFHCERFNFIVPRRIRLVLAIGAAVVLAVLGILFILIYSQYVLTGPHYLIDGLSNRGLRHIPTGES